MPIQLHNIKPADTCVSDFGSLEQDYSEYMLDLLEYIKTDLLRVDKANCATIEEIVVKFKKLNNEYQRDASYCILRNPNRP